MTPEQIVAFALRKRHTILGERAKIIVTVRPEDAAKAAVAALRDAGWMRETATAV